MGPRALLPYCEEAEFAQWPCTAAVCQRGSSRGRLRKQAEETGTTVVPPHVLCSYGLLLPPYQLAVESKDSRTCQYSYMSRWLYNVTLLVCSRITMDVSTASSSPPRHLRRLLQ